MAFVLVLLKNSLLTNFVAAAKTAGLLKAAIPKSNMQVFHFANLA